MSDARRRGLIRLGVLVVVVAAGLILAARGLLSSGSSSKPAPRSMGPAAKAPSRLRGGIASLRLPTPLHGATAAPGDGGLLIIGGADRDDVSTDRVMLLDPSRRTARSAGTLADAMHDAAAATVGGSTLVFGGGASGTFDTVQRFVPGGTAAVVGKLPDQASDLSATVLDGVAYVAGGYDGQMPLGTVLRATAAGRPTRVGTLPTPVRYTALAPAEGRLYAFGGELADGTETNLIQEYDPATRRTSVAGHLPEPVSHAAALVMRGAVYLLGGRIRGVASAQILKFDPGHGVTSRAGHLPSPNFDAAAGVASGIGYLAGGIGADGTSTDSVVAVRP
jgi:hypothetical protein